MKPNDPTDQTGEELTEAWLDLQDAHLNLEGETVASAMYQDHLDAAKDATRRYYRVLDRMSKESQPKIG